MFADNAKCFQHLVPERACQKFVRRAAFEIEFTQSIDWEMLEIVCYKVLRTGADRSGDHMPVINLGKDDGIY
jgi:uncharacterized protein (DUF2344 family)